MKFNELDVKFAIDIIIGVTMFLIGVFFDPIANYFTIQHQQGIGLGQIIWCAFWGLYIGFSFYYQLYYGE